MAATLTREDIDLPGRAEITALATLNGDREGVTVQPRGKPMMALLVEERAAPADQLSPCGPVESRAERADASAAGRREARARAVGRAMPERRRSG